MSRSLLSIVVAAVLTGGGCYQDDTIGPTTGGRTKPFARVLLTDAPFPYDSVASVSLHIVRIDATADPDTSDGEGWVLIAQPNRAFDLLALQQGTTAVLGEAELSGRLYRAVRMVIDADRSSVVWSGGSHAAVNWPWPGTGLITMHAVVEEPLFLLADEDSIEIVIDFDLGRSFLYDYDGTGAFTVLPWLRAVHRAFTGTIAGTVTSNYTGQTLPLRNAEVRVYRGDIPAVPELELQYPTATGRTDAAGRYTVAFVSSGTYTVSIAQPSNPFLDQVIIPNVHVTPGNTTTVSASLPTAGSGGAHLQISGPASLGVGGTIYLRAVVVDASGDPVSNPAVTWTSAATGIATVTGVSDTGVVTGQAAGGVLITATSGDINDTHWVDVYSSNAPVATVTVLPNSARLVAGDTASFSAQLRDSTGTDIWPARPLSWFTTDSSVFEIVWVGGYGALIRARAAGSAFLRATSEGKTGQATITVGPPVPPPRLPR